MSGGFFRGTSADQDTRFSNKQAKLMKSQKFAPELEHVVDMTKVKMDVMRPWIAHRVTELLGFEDEVLINFIYGLLEEKLVNGKEIQISLTGFMEKNTGKFMKELWTLLLSAQKNASGVPQQFLDAKEEETRKKKAETDRITSEIQRKKEKESRELEQEKLKKMAGEVDIPRADNAALAPSSRSQTKASTTWSVDEKDVNGRNGSRGRNRISRSPHSAERSPSSPRGTPSSDRRRSKSISGSPQPVRRSVSSEKFHRSSSKQSDTPHRRDSKSHTLSPPRRDFRHRSLSRSRRVSPSRRISPSPVRRRLHSPIQRRSRSPMRRRSRSPMRRKSRSPMRRRSRSPLRRRSRSPMRRRSRSPIRRRSRSPIRRRSRSPMRRRSRSPIRRRSRTPMRRRSRSPIRYRSRSPVGRRSRSSVWRRSQSPLHSRSPSPGPRRSQSPVRRRYRRAPSTPRRRSPSPVRRRPIFPGGRRLPSPGSMSPPQERTSQSPIHRKPPSLVGKRSPKHQRRSPVKSSRDSPRNIEKSSPVSRVSQKENMGYHIEDGKGSRSRERRPPITVMSPQRDPKDRNISRSKVMSSLYESSDNSESPPVARQRSPGDDRSSGPYGSPVEQSRKQIVVDSSPPFKPGENKGIHDSPESIGAEEHIHAREKGDRRPKVVMKRGMQISTDVEHKDTVEKPRYKNEYSPQPASRRSSEIKTSAGNIELGMKDQRRKSEIDVGKVHYPDPAEQEFPSTHGGTLSNERGRKLKSGEEYKADERSHSRAHDAKGSSRHNELDNVSKLSKKVERNDRSGSLESGSEESDEHRAEVNERKKHKRSKRKNVTSDDDYSNDSHIEDRKESKRRRKEEKKQRKEERRRRREERRRRKEDRRAEKLKLKSIGHVSTPSDLDKDPDGYASDGERIAVKELRANNSEDAVSEPEKLEIELRKKALESLRAKKGISH